MVDNVIVVRRVWRSQIMRLMVYFVLCLGTVLLSHHFPGSVLSGKLFTIGGSTFYLSLPLWSLFAFGGLVYCLLPIYDARMVIDRRGVELAVGILGLQYVVNWVRFEDIRGCELKQSVLERILDVGTLEIASAATEGVEITFDGIGSPRELQNMVQMERDIRKKAELENARYVNGASRG